MENKVIRKAYEEMVFDFELDKIKGNRKYDENKKIRKDRPSGQ